MTKAFDTVNREALWTVLERIGCPPKLVTMIRLLHDGMTGQVLSNGNVMDAFMISNGMKQGCILAPVLFNVFFTYMLSKIWRMGSTFVTAWTAPSSTCIDSQQRRRACKSPPRVSLCQHLHTSGPRRTRPTVDAGLFLQGIQAHLPDNQSWKDGGAPPTCTILLPPPLTITIDDKPLASVEHCKYLGSTVSCDGSLDREIDTRISKTSQALSSLRNRMLSKHNIHLSMKLKVYNTMVLPSLLYGCETWTLYRRHIKKLELFHMRAVRSILGIRWQDHITNLEVLDQAKSTSIKTTIIKAQLWYVGHVIQMEECRMLRRLMYRELQAGKRNQSRPKLQYKDTVKANLQWCHINSRDPEGYAMDRPKWQGSVHRAAASFEVARC